MPNRAKPWQASWPRRARSPSTSPRGLANYGPRSWASSAALRISPPLSIASSTGPQDEQRDLLWGRRHECPTASRRQLGSVLPQACPCATPAELHAGAELLKVPAAVGPYRHRFLPW